MSPCQWEIMKSRFEKNSYCFFERPCVSTLNRYGTGLTQETIRKKIKKEIITVENCTMCLKSLYLDLGVVFVLLSE